MAPNFDVPVVGPVPLVQRLENLDLMPAETDALGERCSAIVRTLLDVDTHFWFQDPSKRHAAVRDARSQSGRCARGRWQLLLHQPCRRLQLTTLAMRHALRQLAAACPIGAAALSFVSPEVTAPQ